MESKLGRDARKLMVALPLEAIFFGLAVMLEMLFMQQALLQKMAFQRSRRLVSAGLRSLS